MGAFDDAWDAQPDNMSVMPTASMAPAGVTDSSFDAAWDSMPEPSMLSNMWGDVKALPGGLIDTAKAIPSGISNLWNSVVSPVQSIENGTTEKAARGTGTLAAMMAGGGIGAETGAGLGTAIFPGVGTAIGGILGGGLGAAGGYMGYNDANQITGSDASTTAAQDMAAFRRNAVQGFFLGAAGEGAGIGGSKLIGPQTETGALATVGDAMSKYVDPAELAQGIKDIKNDPLGGMRTSAEVLQSPELAIMEQSLGSSADGALSYAAAKAQRGDAAQFILDQVSNAKGLATEDSGAAAQNAAILAEKTSKSNVNDLYDAIPKDTVAKIYPLKMAVNDAVDTFFGPGSPPVPAKLKSTIDFLTDASNKNELPVADLQRARSHTLAFSKEAYGAGNNEEGALAASISKSIRDAIENAPVDATEWQTANAAMREHALKFREDPLSNISDLLPSKVINKILSSPEASKQFTEMVNGEPKALGSVKDQIASNLSDMTDTQRANFIDKNESQLQTLLGKDFQYLDSIRNDIKSRIDTQRSANATAGSNTALKLSSVIEKALTGKTPKVEAGGLWDKLIKGIATGTGITAAYTHPLITIPSVVAAAGVKALRNRSSSLIQDVLGKSLMHPEILKQALETDPTTLSSLFAAIPAAAGTAINNEAAMKKSTLQGLLSSVLAPAVAGNVAASSPIVTEPTSLTSKVMGQLFTPGSPSDSLIQGSPSMNDKPEAPKIVAVNPTPVAQSLADAVVLQESAGKPNAIGPVRHGKTAKGLMQLEDATGKEWHAKLNLPGAYNPLNATQNKKIGTAYLGWLTDQFSGDIKLALAAYNAGIGRIQKLMQQTGAATFEELKPALKKAGLDETLAYVPSVLNRQKLIESALV